MSSTEKRSSLNTVLILAGSLALGLFVLPRLGGSLGPVSPLVGEAAPDFSLPVIAGGEESSRVRLSALAGNVVVLDFWASWCQPCRVQSKILHEVARKYSEDPVVFVGVNTADDPARAKQFALEQNSPYPSVLDTEGVADQYQAHTLPTLVFVDGQGRITDVASRILSEAQLDRAIREARGL